MKYLRCKGSRFKKVGFYAVTNFDGYWWDGEKWTREVKGGCSSHCPGIRSIRAFRRHLRKWNKYLPKGIEFVLCSRWVGCDVYAKTRKKKNAHTN